MGGKLLTPQDAALASVSEMQVMVNVNDQPTPLPLARLIVLNEQTAQLTRIADVLEKLEARLGEPSPPKLRSV